MDKSAFFAAIKLKSEPFTLPTGDVIELHELTAGNRDKVFPDYEGQGVSKAQARLVALCCSEFTEDDMDRLLNLPSDLLNRMADVVLKLSGMLKEEDPKKTDRRP